ncbi:hypothetical protein AVEN_237196-1 [Araneus ventricosus]|uniref:Uncharacterized protein n=1 Tax=Araneus ventricosus TaxID=182803 RepID=A0A4Y2HX46_ARAVE|nr:hypothetical protein AVEN_237196-1 [Araneus ventricosus]
MEQLTRNLTNSLIWSFIEKLQLPFYELGQKRMDLKHDQKLPVACRNGRVIVIGLLQQLRLPSFMYKCPQMISYSPQREYITCVQFYTPQRKIEFKTAVTQSNPKNHTRPLPVQNLSVPLDCDDW